MFKENYLRRLSEIESRLTKGERKLLQTNSMKNFLLFYDKFQNDRERVEVKILITQYFERVEAFDYIINRKVSTELGFKFILKISRYYKSTFGFKYFNSSFFIPLMQGGVIDLGLLFFGVFEKMYFVPIASLFLVSRWLYIRIVYVPKKMVFGIRY